MLRGGPRGYIEATYATWAEDAAALRAYVKDSVDEIRATRALYQSMVEQRATADHEVLEAIAALMAMTRSTDVTAIHARLADALVTDVWSALGTHSDEEAKRFATICRGLEDAMYAAVDNLRDAHLGKPSFPILKKRATSTERLLFRFRCVYISVVRVCADVRDVAFTFAAFSGGLACIALLIRQISRISGGH